jgi:hypothetical protein
MAAPANKSASLLRKKQVAALATAALLAIAYFVAIIVVMHFLRPDHDPMRRPTSEYAVGPYGFLMTSAFVSMSLGSLALVVGLYRTLSEPARSRIGLGLLGVWVAGLLIAATFPIDLEGAPQTTSGTVHRINGPITFLSLTAGAILVSRGFKHDERWWPVHRTALILSLVMLAEFIVNVVSIASGSGYPGLGQRVFIATFVTWLLLTAARLHSLAVDAGSR